LSHSCNLALLRACSSSCLLVQVELTVLCDEDDDPVVCTSDLDLTLHNITFRLATTPTTSNLPYLFSLSCHLSLSQLHPISPHPVLRHLPTPLTLFTSLYPPHTLTSLPTLTPSHLPTHPHTHLPTHHHTVSPPYPPSHSLPTLHSRLSTHRHTAHLPTHPHTLTSLPTFTPSHLPTHHQSPLPTHPHTVSPPYPSSHTVLPPYTHLHTVSPPFPPSHCLTSLPTLHSHLPLLTLTPSHLP